MNDETLSGGAVGAVMHWFALNEAVGRVTFDDPRDAAFFAAFFDEIEEPPPGALIIELRMQRPPAALAPEATHVEDDSIHIVSRENVTWIWSTGADPELVLLIGRRLLRQLWFDHRLRSSALIVVHASAVYDDTIVLAFVGDRYSGKTTMLVDSLASTSMAILTNDNLVVYRSGSKVMLTCTPTHIRIRGDVVARFSDFLASRMTDAANSLELDRWHQDPLRHGEDMPLLASFGAFGRPCFPTLRLSDRRLVVVDTRFASSSDFLQLERVASSPSELASFITANLKDLDEVRRFLYMSPPYLVDPGPIPGESELVDAVARAADHVLYRHDGRVTPLLEFLSGPSQR